MAMKFKEDKVIKAANLYQKGKLTLGRAAEIAGLPKREFAELLGSYGVSIFNYPVTDISKDVKNA
jgi:predicted HTH domain antitoxin